MITGYDSVVVLGTNPAEVVRRFLDGWAVRWPDMLVAVDEGAFEPWAGDRRELAAGRAEILVARDAGMDAFWDEHGYALDATGEGPFAIYYSPYRPGATRMLALENPYDHGEGFRFEPYEVVVAGAGLSLLTLVSPDDAGEFTAELLRSLIAETAVR